MRGYTVIALDNPKYDANIGGALRATQCYGGSLIVVSGTRFRKWSTDTTSAYKHIPILRTGDKDIMEFVPYNCIPVAVEFISEEKSISLPMFEHPERAFYVFGAEDNTLGARVLDKCKCQVYVPTSYCMNLAATVNVVLYDRLSKAKRREQWWQK